MYDKDADVIYALSSCKKYELSTLFRLACKLANLLGGHLLHADPRKLRGQPGELARNDLKYNSAFERVLLY